MDIWVISSLTIINKASLNISRQALCEHIFSFLQGKSLGDKMAGSYDKYIFNFIRNYWTVFQSSHII